MKLVELIDELIGDFGPKVCGGSDAEAIAKVFIQCGAPPNVPDRVVKQMRTAGKAMKVLP